MADKSRVKMKLGSILIAPEKIESTEKDNKNLFALLKAYGLYKSNYANHIVFDKKSQTLGKYIL